MKPKSQFYSRYFTYIKPVVRFPIVRTYGSTIFTLFIVIIFIFFAIKPTIETILVLQKKLSETNDVLEKVNKKSNDLSQGKENYDNLDEAIKTKIALSLPSDVNLKSLIQILENSANTHQASISALQIQPITVNTKVQNTGKLEEISFTFNVQGEYRSLTSILQDLKRSGRIITIDHVSLSKVSEGSGLIMSMTGKTYYIK